MRVDLYHLWDCPQSTRVRDFIERNHLRGSVNYVDVDDEIGAEERLEKLSGSTVKPCLMVDDYAVRDGSRIIEWLRHCFLGDRPAPSLS